MEFPESHIHHPQAPHIHTHTVILLHGRGSDGPEFAEELFSSSTSKGKNLSSCLPSYRWVFPTSRDRWSSTFEEEMCTWFDAYSLGNIHERQELQKDGIRESVLHILDILEEEARLLEGRVSHIYLGGMSQGMATALWAFLAASATGRVQGPLGGLLGFCGWLPFAQQLEQLLSEPSLTPGSSQAQSLISGFFFDEIAGGVPRSVQPVDSSILSTPVFVSHGSDDSWVSVELGRQACLVLRRIMVRVDWQEFTGAEGDGHWVKEPEGFDHILKFLEG
ncbi:Phospholipase/carboxylesterase/thioesterase [Penicillium italicum]|uniref:Phospholipase/carboxylesterase/thioesterase n=1 Tax=Penicillium italicum TaxID=40296 RepID=A0A0A2LCP2_PENIT|nr:Phospholipase/carboxylesterase/thioesterase [Penicillium italicum]